MLSKQNKTLSKLTKKKTSNEITDRKGDSERENRYTKEHWKSLRIDTR